MSTTLRTFLALTLESEARETLARLARQLCRALEPHLGGPRPTRPDQLHVTVAFLGDTGKELVPEVSRIAEQVACRHTAPILQGDRILFLPSPRHARVIALGFSDEQGRASAFARDLGESLLPVGFTPEQRPFLPHITLLRSGKPLRGPAPESVALKQNPKEIVLRLEGLTYYASFLEATGARHEILSTTSFRTST